jgi:hypothetical protein
VGVTEQWGQPPEGWPTARELETLRRSADLVLLPDRVERKGDGTVVAAFREDAQAFRVDALRKGLTVELARPPDSRLAAYREHAADWILPFVLGVPTSVITGLVINRLQRWLDERGDADATPTVRYREARLVEGEVRVREVEGPADEVIALLQASDNDPPDDGDEPPSMEPGR